VYAALSYAYIARILRYIERCNVVGSFLFKKTVVYTYIDIDIDRQIDR
jgi:hypothetical protein